MKTLRNMGLTATLDLKLFNHPKWTPIDLIHHFLECGWTLDDHGQLRYIPVGDIDSSDWEELPPKEIEKLFQIFKEKFDAMEPLVFTMLDNKTKSGGIFYLYPSLEEISIICNINRPKIIKSDKVLHWYGSTDFMWYLNSINTILLSAGFEVYGIFCEHF